MALGAQCLGIFLFALNAVALGSALITRAFAHMSLCSLVLACAHSERFILLRSLGQFGLLSAFSEMSCVEFPLSAMGFFMLVFLHLANYLLDRMGSQLA